MDNSGQKFDNIFALLSSDDVPLLHSASHNCNQNDTVIQDTFGVMNIKLLVYEYGLEHDFESMKIIPTLGSETYYHVH